MATRKLYEKNTYLFTTQATILSTRIDVASKLWVIFDQTIFYPQGGGQPSDSGFIVQNDTASPVLAARMNYETRQVEHHIDAKSDVVVGQIVTMEIDKEKRLLHSRLHSAGHLLDYAIDLLRIPLVGVKGYHFPEKPFVEYQAADGQNISELATPLALSELKSRMMSKCQELIKFALSITTEEIDPRNIEEPLRSKIPAKAFESDVVRLIKFDGSKEPGPCGGTHVSNTSEIGPSFSIDQITFKKGIVRILYNL